MKRVIILSCAAVLGVACAKPPEPPPPRTAVVKLMTDVMLDSTSGFSSGGSYTNVDGFGHVAFHVELTQKLGDEPPVDLGFVFAFDEKGKMGSRRLADIETATKSPQVPNFFEVSGVGSWHGEQGISSYAARSPVIAPFVQVFVYNRARVPRRVSVWAYLSP